MKTGVVLRRWLRDTIGTHLLWTTLGLLLVSATGAGLYAVGGNPGLFAGVRSLDEQLTVALGGNGANPESTVLLWVCALALVLVGTAQGAHALAADEQRGYLELTLAHAVTRGNVVAARLIGLTLRLTTMFALIWAGVVVVNAQLNLPHSLLSYGPMVVGAWLLVVFHAVLAFTLGAATGRVWFAVVLTTVIAVAGLLTTSHGKLLASWLPEISPFQWAIPAQEWGTGWNTHGLASLATACVLAGSLAFVFFARRPLRTP